MPEPAERANQSMIHPHRVGEFSSVRALVEEK
jgi:hypothetical protein